MSPITNKIVIGVLVIAVGGGTVIVISQKGQFLRIAPTRQPGAALTSSPAAVHSADWYVAHPAIAKQDEDRCGEDAATISQAACQNVESAEQELLANEMKSAAATNGFAGSNNNAKTP